MTDHDPVTFALMMETVGNRKQSMRRHQKWEQDTIAGGVSLDPQHDVDNILWV